MGGHEQRSLRWQLAHQLYRRASGGNRCTSVWQAGLRTGGVVQDDASLPAVELRSADVTAGAATHIPAARTASAAPSEPRERSTNALEATQDVFVATVAAHERGNGASQPP